MMKISMPCRMASSIGRSEQLPRIWKLVFFLIHVSNIFFWGELTSGSPMRAPSETAEWMKGEMNPQLGEMKHNVPLHENHQNGHGTFRFSAQKGDGDRDGSEDNAVDLVKSWKSTKHLQAHEKVEKLSIALEEKRREFLQARNEELKNFEEMNVLKDRTRKALEEEIKNDPELKEKLAEESKNLQGSKNLLEKEWMEVVEKATMKKQPSTIPAFFRWLLRFFWKNPRDYILKTFFGKSYRKWKASKYLESMIVENTFEDRQDIQTALRVLYKKGTSELNDEHNRFIISLKREGLKSLEEKHHALVRNLLEEAPMHNMFTSIISGGAVHRHIRYLKEAIHDLQFTQHDARLLVNLQNGGFKLVEDTDISRYNTLLAKESLARRLGDELEASTYIHEQLSKGLELRPEQQKLLSRIHDQPEKPHLESNEVSPREKELLDDLDEFKKLREQFIYEQMAEILLRKDRETGRRKWTKRQLEVFELLQNNHREKTGPKLLEGADKEELEKFVQEIIEESPTKNFLSPEKTKTRELDVKPSANDLLVVKPEPVHRADEVEAIGSLKGLNVGGDLKLEAQSIISKLQNRVFVISPAQLNAFKEAATVARKQISEVSESDLAVAMLDLEKSNHFFPADPARQQLLAKIRNNEALSLPEGVMIKSLAKAYRRITDTWMSDIEVVRLALTDDKTAVNLPEDQLHTLTERIDRYAVTLSEYYTITRALEKQKFFTPEEWFLFFPDHAEHVDAQLSQDAAAIKAQLNPFSKSTHESRQKVEEIESHVKTMIEQDLVKTLGQLSRVEQVKDIVGAVRVDSTEFERLQLISQLEDKELQRLSEIQNDYEKLNDIVKLAEQRLFVMKEHGQLITMYEKEGQILDQKAHFQQSLTDESLRNLEDMKEFLRKKHQSYNLDQKLAK